MNPTTYAVRWILYAIGAVLLLALGEKIPGWWKRMMAAARYRAWRDE